MGNKRKASIIIFSVIIAAFALFTLGYDIFSRIDFSSHTVKAGTNNRGSAITWSGSGNNTENFASGTYMVVITGANGGGSNAGYGATCVGFVQGSSTYTWLKNGGGSAFGGSNGGNSQGVEVNFALPSAGSKDTGYAGGGGGGGSWSAAMSHAVFKGYEGNGANAYAKFDNVLSHYGIAQDSGITLFAFRFHSRTGNYTGCYIYGSSLIRTSALGTPATQSRPGYNGRSGGYSSSYGYMDVTGADRVGYAWYMVNNVHRKEGNVDLGGSGGGAGYKDGGGGNYHAAFGNLFGKGTTDWVDLGVPGWWNTSDYGIPNGGGGSSSPNLYPVYASDSTLGVKSSPSAGYTFYRIDPSAYPTLSGTKLVAPAANTRYTPGSALSAVKDYIKTAWVYSGDNGATWSTNIAVANNTTAGTVQTLRARYVIYGANTSVIGPAYGMQYTTPESAAKDANYIIVDQAYTAINKGTCAAYAPVGADTRNYDGGSHYLLKSAGSVATGNGVIKYSVDLSNWYTSFQAASLVGTNAGTYTVYYKVFSNNSALWNDSGIGSVTATINRINPSWWNHTLTASSKIYSGSPQKLFAGSGATNEGTITYALTRSSTQGPDGNTVTNTSVGNLTSGPEKGTWYLWYTIAQSTNYYQKGWTCTGISASITGATCTVGASQSISTTSVMYDGAQHNMFDVATPVMNGGNSVWSNYFDIRYKRIYTGNNNNLTDVESSQTDDIGSLQKVVDAGHYKIKYRCTALNTNICDSSNGWLDLCEFDVTKTNNAGIITVNGLSKTDVVTLGSDGKAFPFSKNVQSIEFSINGVSRYNGVTAFTNNNDGKNKVSYYWGKGASTAPADGLFNVCSSASALNSSITIQEADSSGMWYLWLRIDDHNSIATGTKKRVADITVNGFDANSVPLSGITMTGAVQAGQNKDGVVTYCGSGYAVASGELTVTNSALNIGTVWYAVGDSSSTIPGEDEWKGTVADLPTKTNKGTYYLWVRWSAGTNVVATSGRCYASFTIEQLNLSKGSYRFGGLNINGSNPTVSGNLSIYAKTFDNTAQKLIATQPTAISAYAVLKNSTTITTNLAGDFGAFTLGVSTSSLEMNSAVAYKPLINYGDLTVTDVLSNSGRYYIWVKWVGNENVAPGEMVYTTGDAASITIPCFQINKLTDESVMELYNPSFVVENNGGNHPYLYHYDYGAHIHVADAQPLFATNGIPVFKISGNSYEISSGVSYLLTEKHTRDSVENVTATTLNITGTESGWTSSIDLAKVKAVGTYHLWMKIVVDNLNTEFTKYIDLGSASITAVRSEVFEKPISRGPLTVDLSTFLQLIDKSAQITPAVEYSLGDDYDCGQTKLTDEQKNSDALEVNGVKGVYDEGGSANWKWSQRVDVYALKAISAGPHDGYTYKVYYRGAEMKIGDVVTFETQTMEYSEYPFILVTVQRANPQITADGMPTAKTGVYYTGKEIPISDLVTKGIGHVENSDVTVELLYSWEGYRNTFYPWNDPRLSLTESGTHVLYVAPETLSNPDISEDDTLVSAITVTINKVDVEVSTPVLSGNGTLIYDAAEYPVLAGIGDYYLKHNSALVVDGSRITYKKYINGEYDVGSSKKFGKMGMLYFAVSSSPEIQPLSSEWYAYNEIARLTVRQVGEYYLWIKVNAGDNHNAVMAYCLESSKITVIPATESDVRLVKSSYSLQRDDNGDAFRYNGLSHSLLSNLSLVIEVRARDEEGELTSGYNLMASLDKIGAIYYALTDSPIDYPAVTDLSASGWHSSWQTLSKTNFGTYYLWIMIVPDSDGSSNLSNENTTPIIVCLSTLNTENGEDRDEINIEKATWNDLDVAGFFASNTIYTGDNLSIGDLTNGHLTVSLKSSRYEITDKIINVKYSFWNVTKNGTENPVYNWTNLENTNAVEVGKYQLYVSFDVLGGNIDTNEKLIYPLFVVPGTYEGNDTYYAEIRKVDGYYLNVIAPEVFDNIIYNGAGQRLIKTHARLEMKNGNTLGGVNGTAWYCISDSSSIVPGVTADWDSDFTSVNTKIKRVYAGSYYVWVKFEVGYSHTSIEPRCVAVVTIHQATEDGIDLIGLGLLKGAQYNGNQYPLVNNPVTQKFRGSNIALRRNIDYKEIYYAYSYDPHSAPKNWSTEDEIDHSVWKSEGELNSLQARDAGSYYIWIKVVGIQNPETNTVNVADYMKCYWNSDNDYAEIIPATLTNSYFENINPHEGLSYIAQTQALADFEPNTDGKLTIRIDEVDVNLNEYNDNITVQWGLGSYTGQGVNSLYAPTANKWVSNLTDFNVLGYDAGDYYLWIKVVSGSNGAGYENIYPYYASVAKITIAKATIEFISQPGYYGDTDHEGLTYTLIAQTLLTSDPVFKFKAGTYCTEEYYPANELTLRYAINSTALNITDYRDVQGINATSYEIYYGFFDNKNWNEAIEHVVVTIAPRDASELGYGLEEAPVALLGLAYNESVQDLISFGSLVKDAFGRGAAVENSKIVFWYADNADVKYRYYYDTITEKYVWENGEKLPGRVNAGSYNINYQVTGVGNYKNSSVNTLTGVIAKRQIWWKRNPEPVYGLKYNGMAQEALRAGILNVDSNALGVTVKYSVQVPGTVNRAWQTKIPEVDAIGVWDVYYYVDVDENNVFIGQENNDPVSGTLVQVLVERFTLSITALHKKGNFMYTAEPQSLIAPLELSTDGMTAFAEEDLPYFEYSFDQANWSPNDIKAVDRGTYTIYYRLVYKPTIFEFSGDHPAEGIITSVIDALTIAPDSVRAVYNEDTGKVSLSADTYSAAIKSEFMNYLRFEYRVYDDYNHDNIWREWHNEATVSDGVEIPRTILGLGNYQFRVVISNDDVDSNFKPYTQEGSTIPYDEYSVVEDRVVYIEMPEGTYSTPPYVRAWLDFTGNMVYDDTPEQFRHEGWVNTVDSLFFVFRGVNSTGTDGRAVLRIQTVNNGYYFRTTDDYYSSFENRKKTLIDWEEEENYIYSYQGLPTIEMHIKLYEVYHVQYNGNGAELIQGGIAPSDGWKWHGVDYFLEENVYTKTGDDGKPLTSNGWNTTRAGNGNNYPNGSYYRENASQIFYANFFTANDILYAVDWIITTDDMTYRIARNTGKWFNAANYDHREAGTYVAQGELITLPQVIEDEDGKKFWSGTLFGNYYIKGWYAARDDWKFSSANDVVGESWKGFEYYLNMTATRDITFVAVLASKSEKGVQCNFKDDDGNLVSSSGMIANGANAYMALSGMDAATIKNYQDGYNQWVEAYGNTQLEATDTGLPIEYNLGTKRVIEIPTEETNKNKSNNDLVVMFVILAIGIITTCASLVVYIIMRKKYCPIDLKKFKEEK